MVKYESLDEYVESLPQKTKEKLLELREIVMEALPVVKEVMAYGVPAFDLKEKAKLNDKIMIAGFKNHVGFYPNPDTIVYFKDKLIPFKTLKGTIQFQLKDDLPKDLIKEMVKHRYNVVNKKTE